MTHAAATMRHRHRGEGPVPLTNRLSRLMGERRLTVRRVADGTGLDYRVILDLYHDRSTRLDVRTLARLCDYLGVGPGEVFEWTPPAPPPAGAD
jgi:putative transcriptional regulator